MFKRITSAILLSAALIFCVGWTGCKTLKEGDASRQEEKGRSNIEAINKQISTNAEAKLDAIAAFAWGIDYELRLIPDAPREVDVSLNLVQRIASLSGSPNLDKMKEMKEMIDQLNSEVGKVRLEGQKKLEAKDAEIVALQTAKKDLEASKDKEIAKYMRDAREAAAVADTEKAARQEFQGQMNSWWGLGAVFYGFKTLLIRIAWFVGIAAVLFLIVRIGAATNPVLASIYGVFSVIGSWFFNGVKVLFGEKAAEMAGHVPQVRFDQYKSVVVKIIDAIQLVKDRAAAAGKEPILSEAMNEVAKSMDLQEKELVDKIKRELNWK
jgi:hypothetical protein